MRADHLVQLLQTLRLLVSTGAQPPGRACPQQRTCSLILRARTLARTLGRRAACTSCKRYEETFVSTWKKYGEHNKSPTRPTSATGVKTVPRYTPRAATVPRWNALPRPDASRSYFLLGQNARGLWVIRESTGRSAGVFLSRDAALRFARLECPNEHVAVVPVTDVLEFDYAA